MLTLKQTTSHCGNRAHKAAIQPYNPYCLDTDKRRAGTRAEHIADSFTTWVTCISLGPSESQYLEFCPLQELFIFPGWQVHQELGSW